MKHFLLFRQLLFYGLLLLFTGLLPGKGMAQTLLAIAGPDTVCVGDAPTYTFSPVIGNLIYTWSVSPASQGTVYSPNTSATVVSWNTAGTATLKIVGKDTANNIIAEDSITIVVDSALHPVLTSSYEVHCMPLDTASSKDSSGGGSALLNDTGCTKVCAYSPDTFSVPAVSGASYSWQVTGASSYTPAGNTCIVHWGAAGSGNVTVTETRGSCSATATMCIQIIAGPVAVFTTMPNTPMQTHIQICLNSTVTFIDQSIPPPGSPIVAWLWDFGDGNSYSSSGSGPISHTYTQPGNFIATLTVTDACGCSASYGIQVEVSKDSSKIKIECPRVSCENEPLTYFIESDTALPCPGFWTAQGGSLVGPTPTQTQVIWNNVGPSGFGYLSYTLTCAPCPAATTIKVPVMQSQGTIQGEATVCPNKQYEYTLPQWPTTQFTWSVSGNATLTGTDQPNKVVVTSGASGSYTLSVSYCNTLIDCSGSATLTANILPAVSVSGQTTVCLNSTETYQLTGTPTATWILTAPNNATTTYNNVGSISPTFTQSGAYTLSVSGSFCAPDPLIIQVKNPPPMPTAIQGPDSACLGVPLQYTAQAPVSGTVFQWYTSNGTVNAAAGASTYATFSSLPAQLKVVRVSTGPAHCVSDTFTRTIYQIMPPISLSSNLPASDTVCGSTQWNFHVNYAGADLYQWQILDPQMGSVVSGATTSQTQILFNNPGAPGTNVWVIVKVTKCFETQSDTMRVYVRGVPGFTAAPDTDSVCAGVPVSFSITPTPVNYSSINWAFGDGGSANVLNPSHSYPNNSTVAVYHPSVTIVNPYGCTTTVTVPAGTVAVKPAPVAFVSVESTNGTGCGPFSAWLEATVTAGYGQTANYQWSGPTTNPAPPDCDTCSHWNVNQYGGYYVTVTNTNGCSSNSNITGFTESCDSCPGTAPTLAGSADSITGCGTAGLTLTYNGNGVTIIGQNWAMAPTGANLTNTTTGFTATADASFENAGIYHFGYVVRYINANNDTCKVTFAVTVTVPYMGGMLYDISCGTGSNYDVTLHDHSNLLPNQTGHILHSYFYKLHTAAIWTPTVGQNTTATSYSFSLPAGTYDFKEVISSNLAPANNDPPCTTETDSIVLPDKPQAGFTDSSGILPPHHPCERDVTVYFHNTSTPATGLSYLWSFGDNSTNYQTNPGKVYANPGPYAGNYIVTLTVINSIGCIDSISDSVQIANDPYWNGNNMAGLHANPSVPQCPGTPVTLAYMPPTGYSGFYPSYFTWYRGTAPLTVPTLNLSSYPVTQTGGYRVIGSNLNGCRVPSSMIAVSFKQVPPAVISGSPNACNQETFTLNGYAGNISGLTYQWTRNPGNVSIGTTASVTQTLPPGTYTYTLTLGLNGCTATSVPFTVTVHPLPPPPVPAFSIIKCKPYTVKLTATNTQTGTYNWSNGGFGTPVYAHAGGPYQVVFTDQYGCKSRDTLDVPRSPEEYMWIFPTGCFCKTDVTGWRCKGAEGTGSPAHITGPVIPFHYWAYLFNGSVDVSGTGLVQDYSNYLTLGPGTYNLVLNNGYCSDTSGNMYYDGLYCQKVGKALASPESESTGQTQGPLLELIPNPTTGKTLAKYRFVTPGEEEQIRVYDPLGRKVGSYRLSGREGSIELPVQGLAAGMYQVLLLQNGKLVKESKLSKTQ